MRILLSGAHLTPALAMIDFIQQNHPEHQLVFVGRLYSQETLNQKAIEKTEVEKRGIKFIPFAASKFTSTSLWNRFNAFCSFPHTVTLAKQILLREKIELFLSFGSYLAVPFAIAAKNLKIPVVTHEQTVMMGKANQFIVALADKVAISHEATRNYSRRKDLILTGNPVRSKIFAKNLARPKWLPITCKNLILVMGGNQGSFAINDLIKANLPTLLKKYCIVHQCGRANKIRDSYQELSVLRQQLPKVLQSQYFVQEWIEEEDLFWLYQHAQFAISRSGANAVLELSLASLPAILIPLPSAKQNEQLANAQAMQQLNGALILQQAKLTNNTFLDSLAYLDKNYRQMRLALAKQQLYQNASAKLYQVLMDAARAKHQQ